MGEADRELERLLSQSAADPLSPMELKQHQQDQEVNGKQLGVFSHGEASVDEVLIHEVGQFGRAQWLVLLVSGLGFVTVACTMFLATFTNPSDPGAQPGNWICRHSPSKDPQCFNAYTRLNNLALPQTKRVISIRNLLAAKADDHSTAHVAEVVSSEPVDFCDLSRDQYEWVNPHATLATRFDLVCGHAWKAELLQTLFFTGVMTGNGVLGKAADVYGRKAMIMCSCIGLVATTLMSAAAPMFWLHAAMRVLSGAMAAGTALGGYVLVSEYVGPAWHGTAGMISQTFFIFGELLLVGMALLAIGYGWISLTLCTVVPPILMGMLAWVVPESPRWLLTVGRKDEAVAALHWVGTWNKSYDVARPRLTADGSAAGGGGSYTSAGNGKATLELSGSVHGRSQARHETDDDQETCRLLSRDHMHARQAHSLAGSSPAHVKSHLIPASSIDLGCAARLDAAHSMRLLHADPSVALSDTLDVAESCVKPSSAAGAAATVLVQCGGGNGGMKASQVAGGRDTQPGHGQGDVQSDESTEEYWTTSYDQCEMGQRLLTATDAEVKGEGLGKLLKHPALARLLLVTIYTMWTLSMSYFGVGLASSSLAGGLYLNFSLTAAAELPAYLMIIMYVDKVGRKTVVLGGAAMAGAALVAVSLLPDSATFLQVALAMLGKFGCSGAWAMGLIFTSELFPTSCRSAAVGIISQAGDMGGLLAPLLMLLGQHMTWSRFPFMVMGLLSFVASGMVAVLPETLGLPHSNTIKEMLAVLSSRPNKS